MISDEIKYLTEPPEVYSPRMTEAALYSQLDRTNADQVYHPNSLTAPSELGVVMVHILLPIISIPIESPKK
jgi:hypothetical protein